MSMKKNYKRFANMDDGCNPELVVGAKWSEFLELPIIKKPVEFIIPDTVIPFSMKNRKNIVYEKTAICAYEKDFNFSSLLIAPETSIKDIKPFQMAFSPDCSMYYDMPLSYQIINLTRNRALGYFMQRHGIYTIPTVRWGDERTYTTEFFQKKIAFLGVEKHSIVSIGSYGVVKERLNRYHFEAGLEAMLEELSPVHILVYGSDNTQIFAKYEKSFQFHYYPDYTSLQHGKE